MFSKAFEGLASSMVFVPTEKRSIVSVFNFFNSHISLLHTLSTGKKMMFDGFTVRKYFACL